MLQTWDFFGEWAVFLHHHYSLLARRQPSCGECSSKTLYWLNSWAWKRCIHTSGVPNAEQMWNSLFKTDRLSSRLMLNQEEIPARKVLPNSGKISSENISQNKYGKFGRKNDEYGTQYSIPLYLLWNIWNCIRNTKTEKEVRFYPLTSSLKSPSLFFHTLVL